MRIDIAKQTRAANLGGCPANEIRPRLKSRSARASIRAQRHAESIGPPAQAAGSFSGVSEYENTEEEKKEKQLRAGPGKLN